MDEEFAEFLQIFREESLERLVNVSKSLEAISDGGSLEEHLEEVDRELHTIKGSARLLGFPALGLLVHEIEGLACAYRARPGLGLRLLVECADRLSALVEQASQDGEDCSDDELAERVRALAVSGEEDPQPSLSSPGRPADPLQLTDPGPPQAAPEPLPPGGEGDPASEEDTRAFHGHFLTTTQTLQRGGLAPATDVASRTSKRLGLGEDELVRVRASRLQDLDGIVSELSLTHLRLNSHESELRRLLQSVEEGGLVMSDVSQTLRTVLSDYAGDSNQVRRSAQALQRLAVDVRLRPVEHLFDLIPREARELARTLGKQVRVKLHGGETEIDRVIQHRLKSPLSHLVRNAVDHGLEGPEERLKLGKSGDGHLIVTAGQEGGQVVIRIQDDGRGIDPERVRELAVRRGVVDPTVAAGLSDEEAIQLIFLSGFSTKTVTSEISGRGVGMDVVRKVVEDLGGEVRVLSVPGEGTTTVIRLPLTQLISRITFFRSGGQQFAISTEALQESLRVPVERITTFGGCGALVWEGRSVPLVRFSALLGQRVLPDPEYLSVLLLRYGQELMALVIEELLDEGSVVVKPLGWPLELVRGFSGAVHLPSGEVALLLHPPDLFTFSRSRPTADADRYQRKTILVVDDSLVSRQLVGRCVEALGFDLVTAVDGLDAWNILERVTPDLIVTDVEMPRLGGLALSRRLRGTARLSAIPIIIVSTRGSESDRKAGLEAGADAYLTKAEVNEKSFRHLVERLI